METPWNDQIRLPCAACRHLRRKCPENCMMAPYFPAGQRSQRSFEALHKVYGHSNVFKLLQKIEPKQREDAIKSLVFEAECRLRSPEYGCVGLIATIRQQLTQTLLHLESAKKDLATRLGQSVPLNDPQIAQQQLQQDVGNMTSLHLQQMIHLSGNLSVNPQQSQQQQQQDPAGPQLVTVDASMQELVDSYICQLQPEDLSLQQQLQDLLTHQFLQQYLQQRHASHSQQPVQGETSDCGMGIDTSRQSFTSDDLSLQFAHLQTSHSEQDTQRVPSDCGKNIMIEIDDEEDPFTTTGFDQIPTAAALPYNLP